ncbi:MAG: biopolymer transporter ExbD [Planctomycetaceae bacterium]
MASIQVPAIDGAPSEKTEEEAATTEPVDDLFEDSPAPSPNPAPTPDINITGPVVVGPAPEDDEEDEGFSIRSMESDMEDMDLTPMVDVTFLLLIFFMISASFSLQKTMQYPPPEPDEEGATTQMVEQEEIEETSILIEIDANNTIMIGEELEVIADPALVAEKISEYARRQSTQEVMLTANDLALHDTVVWVLDSASEAGIQKVRIASTPE